MKKIDTVNVSRHSCRKIDWKIKIDILEGGIVLHLLLERPPRFEGLLKVQKVQRTQRCLYFGLELYGDFFLVGLSGYPSSGLFFLALFLKFKFNLFRLPAMHCTIKHRLKTHYKGNAGSSVKGSSINLGNKLIFFGYWLSEC